MPSPFSSLSLHVFLRDMASVAVVTGVCSSVFFSMPNALWAVVFSVFHLMSETTRLLQGLNQPATPVQSATLI